MILGILPVKCYNGILCACGILHILSALINTNIGKGEVGVTEVDGAGKGEIGVAKVNGDGPHRNVGDGEVGVIVEVGVKAPLRNGGKGKVDVDIVVKSPSRR